MVSQTKENFLAHHQANTDLNLALPHPMMHDANDLSADSMIAPLDEQIIASASQALEDGNTHYVDVPGIAPLRDAIAAYLNKLYGSEYATGNMIVTAGVQESRFLTIQKISENFDDAIAVPEVVHPGVLKVLGMRARQVTKIAVDSSQSALASVESIQSALEAGTKLLYLESPSRLTGECYSQAVVADIANLAKANDATVLWDQGLAPWVDDSAYTSLLSQADMASNSVAIGEAFPGMGLASWFIGYIAAPEELVPAVQSQKQIMAICTSTATQFAALEASKLYATHHVQQQQYLGDMKRNLIAMAQEANLDVIDGQAANIFAIRVAGNKSSVVSALNNAGFQVADGVDFGAADVIRLSVGQQTEHALSAIV